MRPEAMRGFVLGRRGREVRPYGGSGFVAVRKYDAGNVGDDEERKQADADLDHKAQAVAQKINEAYEGHQNTAFARLRKMSGKKPIRMEMTAVIQSGMTIEGWASP